MVLPAGKEPMKTLRPCMMKPYNMQNQQQTMTGTKVSYRLLGTAWPGHFNKAIAEAVYKNI